jgi:hypothetical protein
MHKNAPDAEALSHERDGKEGLAVSRVSSLRLESGDGSVNASGLVVWQIWFEEVPGKRRL